MVPNTSFYWRLLPRWLLLHCAVGQDSNNCTAYSNQYLMNFLKGATFVLVTKLSIQSSIENLNECSYILKSHKILQNRHLTITTKDKPTVEILQNIVVFSEYMNFGFTAVSRQFWNFCNFLLEKWLQIFNPISFFWQRGTSPEKRRGYYLKKSHLGVFCIVPTAIGCCYDFVWIFIDGFTFSIQITFESYFNW